MQHATVAGVNKVLYVKASMYTIIQVVIVRFTDNQLKAWKNSLRAIMHIKITPELIQSNWGRAVDKNTVDLHVNLRIALVELAREKGAIPIIQYVKPTLTAMWNRVKCGADVVSRLLSHAELPNQTYGPDEYIFDRLLKLIMVASYRLFCVLEINVALKEGKITTMFQLNDRRNKIFGSFRKAIGQLGKQLANFIAADEAKAEIQGPFDSNRGARHGTEKKAGLVPVCARAEIANDSPQTSLEKVSGRKN